MIAFFGYISLEFNHIKDNSFKYSFLTEKGWAIIDPDNKTINGILTFLTLLL